MNHSRQIVEHYGLHQSSDDGTWWLLQQGTAVNAIGLQAKYCPFRLKTHFLMCCHNFDLSAPQPDAEILLEYERFIRTSKILQFFDPQYIQDIRSLYVETNSIKDYSVLAKLQLILNPTIGLNNPVNMVRDHDVVIKRLRSSNLASYFIYNIDNNCSEMIMNLSSVASMLRGRLVFAGPKLPLFNTKGFMTCVPFQESLGKFINSLDEKTLRAIGSYRLKQLMRS